MAALPTPGILTPAVCWAGNVVLVTSVRGVTIAIDQHHLPLLIAEMLRVTQAVGAVQ